jgi:hypothetical protein
MNKKTTLSTADDLDEAPVWTAEDFAHAVHRVGLEPVGKKINITLDPGRGMIREELHTA